MKTQIFPIHEMTQGQLAQVAAALKNGAVVAVATDTVYGLAADAFADKAIERIYELKCRPVNMPLQILVDSVQRARQLVQWNESASALAHTCWPGALTMILPPSQSGRNLCRGFSGLGLRVPNYPRLLRLLALSGPLACTSANIHGQPVITAEAELLAFCNHQVEYILTGGILSLLSSTVVDLTDTPTLLREGAFARGILETVLKRPLK